MTTDTRHRSTVTPTVAGEINRCIEEPGSLQLAENVARPPALTSSRANLVAWWQWRYASLNAECSRLEGLLVRALCEAQSYREIGQVALERLHHLTREVGRQRETIVRLREELKMVRKSPEVPV